MVYEWKLPGVMPVSAQTAGEELDRIYNKYGSLIPKEIVNESRDENSPLHPCFEWNDEVAAEKYRETQARAIIRHIVVKESPVEEIQATRAFVNVENSYYPISTVIERKDQMQILFETAMKELESFKRKYNKISELAAVFAAIDEFMLLRRRNTYGSIPDENKEETAVRRIGSSDQSGRSRRIESVV